MLLTAPRGKNMGRQCSPWVITTTQGRKKKHHKMLFNNTIFIQKYISMRHLRIYCYH